MGLQRCKNVSECVSGLAVIGDADVHLTCHVVTDEREQLQLYLQSGPSVFALAELCCAAEAGSHAREVGYVC